jgi:cobalt-zinc-cadmium resistance protein CzcA
MTGIRQDVAVKIFGENLDSLAIYADKTAKIIHLLKEQLHHRLNV